MVTVDTIALNTKGYIGVIDITETMHGADISGESKIRHQLVIVPASSGHRIR